MPAQAAAAAASLLALSCAAGEVTPAQEQVESQAAAIMGGTPATAYPEAVLVTATGFFPCSGVLLAPTVVLTAGHCRSDTKTYAVLAPNAGGQQASGSRDWTTYDGSAATSSDTLLVFLDAPIHLTQYPVIAEGEVAKGTTVVDIGRTLNGTITLTDDYVSPAVTIEGPGTPLGFPYNYEATPDLSQDGDSGGPIEIAGTEPHTVVAIVDTDTVEQMIDASAPIDLFARLDVVRARIEEQIEENEGAGADAQADAKGGKRDAEGQSATDASRDAKNDADARADAKRSDAKKNDASAAEANEPEQGGCAVGQGAGQGARQGAGQGAGEGGLEAGGVWWLMAWARRRRHPLAGPSRGPRAKLSGAPAGSNS